MSWKVLSRAVALARRRRRAARRARRTALTLVPPKPNVFLGVSDRGTTAEFNEFAALTGKHPALLQTFHPWGNSLNAAYERWRETGDAAGPGDLDRRRPDPGRDHHPGADRPRRRRRLPAAAQRLLRHEGAARLHPPAGRAEPLPQRSGRRSTATAARKAANTRPAGTSRPSAGSARSCAAGRRWKGSTLTLAEIGLPPLNRTKGPEPRKPAGGAGEHHLEPAARRLAAGERATSRATTGPAAAGSTGSAPTSTRSIRSGKTSTASTRASSGRASRSRSTSGRSRRSTNRASSNS